MYFDSVEAALSMGGHGGFVWSAYVITTVVVVTILWAPGRRRRRLLQRVAGEIKRNSKPVPNGLSEAG